MTTVAELDARAHQTYRLACGLARAGDPAAHAAMAKAYAAARAAAAAHDQAAKAKKEADPHDHLPERPLEPRRDLLRRNQLRRVQLGHLHRRGRPVLDPPGDRHQRRGARSDLVPPGRLRHPRLRPPQGFDWSGIRDSTDDAVAAMLAIAQE